MDDKWFKRRQKEVGVTAEHIAAKLGRTRSNVSHILNGHQRMSLEWAQAFSEVLQVPLATVLEKAGVTTKEVAEQVSPGTTDGDVSLFKPSSGHQGAQMTSLLEAMNLSRDGITVWRVRTAAMALAGFLVNDWVALDTHQSERTKAGDIVIAQAFSAEKGIKTTLLRRFEPPVMVASSVDPSDYRAHVVDNSNVVIWGKVVASWRSL